MTTTTTYESTFGPALARSAFHHGWPYMALCTYCGTVHNFTDACRVAVGVPPLSVFRPLITRKASVADRIRTETPWAGFRWVPTVDSLTETTRETLATALAVLVASRETSRGAAPMSGRATRAVSTDHTVSLSIMSGATLPAAHDMHVVRWEREARLRKEANAGYQGLTAHAYRGIIGRSIRDQYRPTATPDLTAVWATVTEHTADAGWRGWALRGVYNAAAQSSTPTSSVPNRFEDITQETALTAVARIGELLTDQSATACDGSCGDKACAAELISDYAVAVVELHRVPWASPVKVIGWHVTEAVKCGECALCVGKRRGCEKDLTRPVWLSVGRIIGAALKTVARREFQPDRTEGVSWESFCNADYGYAETIATEARSASVGVTSPGRVSDGLMGIITEAADIAVALDASPVGANGRWTVEMGNAIALRTGNLPTEHGRRTAAAQLRAEAGAAPVRVGRPRALTLKGKPRPDKHTAGTVGGRRVEVVASTLKAPVRNRRTAPTDPSADSVVRTVRNG